MPTLNVPEIGTLNYEVEGHGEPAMAFLHGWCSNLQDWDSQVAHFASRHTVVRPDRRGMGRSVCVPTKRPSDHADDLARILDKCRINKAIIVVHAGGGGAGVDFAARYGDRTLALIGLDAFAGVEPPSEFYRQFAKEIQLPGEFERRYRTFFGPHTNPAIVENVVKSAVATPINVAVAEIEGLAEADTAEQARKVRAPVLWIMAQPTNFDALKSVFSNFTPAVTAGAGHFLQLEVPAQVNAMIETFINQELPRQPK